MCGIISETERISMGSISEKDKFVAVTLTLEDYLSADSALQRFMYASAGMHLLRRHAHHLADQITGREETITDFFYKDGNMVVCIGKNGYDRNSIEQAIKKFEMSNS
jgi:hypothetical protein